MPKKFKLQSLSSGNFRWVEDDDPFGTRQFKDIAGDEYYAAFKLYRIAFIGHGSAVAYYLTALAPRGERRQDDESDTLELHRCMAILGRVDPWSAEVRGDGYINHEQHLVGHWGRRVDAYSAEYLRRDAFVRQNAAAFRRAEQLGATMVNDEVYAVNKLGDVYQICTRGGEFYWASFVVVAMGLGPHRGLQAGPGAPNVPDNPSRTVMLQMQRELAPVVIDLDTFMRDYPEPVDVARDTTRRSRTPPPRQLTIIVHGANAGIDAVQRAWQLGHRVEWLCPAAPIFLRGNRLPIERGVDDVTRRMLVRNSEVVVRPDSGRVRADWTDGGGARNATVDLYVIAVGQEPYAEGAVGDVLFRRGNMREALLSMIWDFDQVFGLPFQTILGYQMPGRRKGFGLQIIGGSTEILTRELRKTFDARRLIDDFKAQLTPLEIEPTREHCDRQIARSESLTRKWGTEQGREEYYQQKLTNWRRANVQRAHFVQLAEAYIGAMAGDRGPIMELLTHQVDPTRVPAQLSTILDRFRDDAFLVGQVATPEWPGTTGGASALLPSQLSAVRAVVAALTAFIPEYIAGGDSNFTTDDRNMLAVHIARSFQGFTEIEADARVSATMSLRRSDRDPLGFHDDELRRTIQERWWRESRRGL